MLTRPHPQATPAIKYDFLKSLENDGLSRDKTQSSRLHEPTFRTSTSDPMTAEEIKDVSGHPSVKDGNLTIYFSTEASRKAYLDLPVNHPNVRLPFPADVNDDRGG